MKIKWMIVILLVHLTPGGALAWPWSWDMFVQPSHRAQKDSAYPKPEETVPVEGKPFFAKNKEDAGQLKNPFAPTQESINRGKQRYETFCEVCHGPGGKGNGPVGKKFVPPTDLTLPYVQHKTDGSIFYIIGHGGLFIMPGYGDSIPSDDRWHLINYIKNVLGKNPDPIQQDRTKMNQR
jgi:mono/diheme cytochrome c family protein